MVRLHGAMFYFSFQQQVSYLLITVFLFFKKVNKKSKGKSSASNDKVWDDLELGRSTCPCSLGLSLQLCSAQMAPVCSVGLIITLASSEIAWIQNLIYVFSVIMALISEGSVSIPKDIFFLHMFIHLISGSLIKCKDCNTSLCCDREIYNACVLLCGCHVAYN